MKSSLLVGVTMAALLMSGGCEAWSFLTSTSEKKETKNVPTVLQQLSKIQQLGMKNVTDQTKWQEAILAFKQAVENRIKRMPSWGLKSLSTTNRKLISEAEDFLSSTRTMQEFNSDTLKNMLQNLEPKSGDAAATRGIKVALQIAIYVSVTSINRNLIAFLQKATNTLKTYQDILQGGEDKIKKIIEGAN